MLHRIMSSVNRNSKGETFAVCMTIYDYKQAFSRQCHKLGIESFIRNGVRPSLIPLLINYFQGRNMRVNWKNKLSTVRDLPGSGARAASLGIGSISVKQIIMLIASPIPIDGNGLMT